MKKIYFSVLLITCFLSQAQIVNIPDINFKNALLNTNCVDTNNDGNHDSDADLNNDGEIQVSEAESVVNLFISLQNITSLEGLSRFINLTHLYCSDNPITEFDTSALTNLEVLRCVDIDEVAYLDFSSNINLVSLECDQNNSLLSLNIQNGNNTNLERMWALDSPFLSCIQVDDMNFANSQGCNGGIMEWCKDNSVFYSENCSLGISDFDYIEISIYPNPAKNVLTINSNVIIESFNIFSSNGKLVKDKYLQNNKVDLSDLNSGIYFVKIESRNKTVTKKIIKK